MPVITEPSGALVVRVPRERVELARTTHRAIIRTFFLIFVILAVVILGGGVALSLTGTTSRPGVLVVGVLFLVVPFLMRAWILRAETRGERSLGSDGVTLLRLEPAALTVGDVTIPWERVTCIYAQTPGEVYSTGGGTRTGSGLRQRMYREGALSTINLAIGVDQAATLNAPEGVINPMRTLPKSGADSGRIDIPFGAYLGADDFGALWPALEAIARERFPAKIVTGDLAWASATASAAGTREKIWKDSAAL